MNIMRRTLIFAILATVAGLAANKAYAKSADSQVLVAGQEINYSLSLGPIKAGQAKLVTTRTTWKDEPAYRIELLAMTGKAVSKIFSMNDTLRSTVLPDLTPKAFWKHSQEADYESVENVSFEDGIVRLEKLRKGTLKTNTVKCSEPVYDMVSLVMVARSLDFSKLKQGQRFEFKVASGLSVSTEYLEYQGRERLKAAGKQNDCLKFALIEPKMEKGKLKETELMVIYILPDSTHLPVGIDFNLKFGTAKARLL